MVSSWVLAGGLASRPATRGVVKQKETFTNVTLQTKTNIHTFKKKKKVTIKRREFLSGCRSDRSHFTASPTWQKPATSPCKRLQAEPVGRSLHNTVVGSTQLAPSRGTVQSCQRLTLNSHAATTKHTIYILTLHIYIYERFKCSQLDFIESL